MNDAGGTTHILIQSPAPVGWYCIGGRKGFCIAMTRKPIFLHRWCMRALLGWEWFPEPL